MGISEHNDNLLGYILNECYLKMKSRINKPTTFGFWREIR